ncbi:MAG TPA: Crp/Fnr family transcriptional regulator [Solirubrobacteraceae bacterium]|nr:Crp/Fnr family transcriptional regulator [Solirubrobacteraceae bacterium]
MAEQSAPTPRDLAEPTWSAGGVRLLDVDPELGAELGPEAFADVQRQLVLPTLQLEKGGWDRTWLGSARGVRGKPRGFLVVAGAVSVDLAIAGQACTRMITTRELVLLDGWVQDSIPVRTGWSVLDQARIAVLDERLGIIGRRWPELMSAILERAAQQIRHALLQQAISQLPRVEDRLLALLWSIADRQGVVRRDGVWVHLPVTHATLAQMIGARRPTVSLGLRALAERGHVRSIDGGWLISRDSIEVFPDPESTPDVVGD